MICATVGKPLRGFTQFVEQPGRFHHNVFGKAPAMSDVATDYPAAPLSAGDCDAQTLFFLARRHPPHAGAAA